MLVNTQPLYPQRPVIIEEMETSVFEFHLTGSRFFGNNWEGSDWDFFTDDTPEARQWLESNGFKFSSADSNYAGDGQCNSVATLIGCIDRDRRDVGDILVSEADVQVQLVTSAKEKTTVQKSLFDLYGKGFTKVKAEARVIWTEAFRMFNVGKQFAKSDVTGVTKLVVAFTTDSTGMSPDISMQIEIPAGICLYDFHDKDQSRLREVLVKTLTDLGRCSRSDSEQLTLWKVYAVK